MEQRIKELMLTPRMYYYELVPQNSVEGLYDLIKDVVNNKTIMVEIGSFSGVSSELFAMHCKEISCVDRWSEYQEIDGGKLTEGERLFDELVSKYKNIKKIKMSSDEASTSFKEQSLDFVYIDASHDYINVKKDINCWLPKVKVGGYIGGHDVTIPGVSTAVNEIFGNTYKQYNDTSWLVQVK